MTVLTEEMLGSVWQCTKINLIDGDTIDFNVNLGLGFFTNARVRLIDVDAPEIFGVKKTSEEYSRGMVAKQLVAQWFYGYGPTFYLQAEHKGIHGRWLGEVWRAVDEQSLNDYLISNYYSNGAWSWYSQEPLIEDWFARNPVTAPGGQHLQAWYNWGRDIFRGFGGKVIMRFY